MTRPLSTPNRIPATIRPVPHTTQLCQKPQSRDRNASWHKREFSPLFLPLPYLSSEETKPSEEGVGNCEQFEHNRSRHLVTALLSHSWLLPATAPPNRHMQSSKRPVRGLTSKKTSNNCHITGKQRCVNVSSRVSCKTSYANRGRGGGCLDLG